jgi:hypothetical protein
VWNAFVSGCDQRQANVNAVMNLRVPQTTENVLMNPAYYQLLKHGSVSGSYLVETSYMLAEKPERQKTARKKQPKLGKQYYFGSQNKYGTRVCTY